jgi:SpoVK/Ycf46/Vps4 family AAA+-type ATPase
MAAHSYIQAFSIDLNNEEEKSSDVLNLFARASQNTPALIIIEDLDRAFPTEGKRIGEKAVSFQTLLNCLDGVGTQDGVIVVATANDPTVLDPAILKRPGRFDRVIKFRNPDPQLRREYYRRFSLALAGSDFERVITKTEGYSFAQLRETYITAAQTAFENGSDIAVDDLLGAIELLATGANELRTFHTGSGFVGAI